MEQTYIEETPVKRRWAAALASALRTARDVGNNVAVPEGTPLVGGARLGDMILGKAPEGAERLAYGERMTSGRGQTLAIRPETLDLAMLVPIPGSGATSMAARSSKAKATIGALRKAPQDEALEIARQNAVKLLKLPENNTAMDRAKAMGYVDDIHGKSYRGNHQAPLSVDDVGAPAHALNRVYPDDVYSSQAYRYYGHGADSAQDANLVRRLQALRNRPDADVPIYRAVPKNASEGINHGDWVTPDRQYAKDHGESVLQGDYKILYDRAPAKSLFTDGNSIYEFGYDKSQKFAQGPASIPIVRSSNPANRERSRFAAFDPARIDENDLLAFSNKNGIDLKKLLADEGKKALVSALRTKSKPNEEEEK